MVVLLVAAVIGSVVGNWFFGENGWFLGLLIGALAGKLIDVLGKLHSLTNNVNTLNRTLGLLTDKLAKLEKQLAAYSLGDHNQSAQITASPESSSEHSNTSAMHEVQAVVADTSLNIELPDLVDEPTPAVVSISPSIAVKPTERKPDEPGLLEKQFKKVMQFFTQGNPIVRVGMVVMFFGVSFLVKYASSQGLLPIEYRLSGVILVAIALIVVGWKTRAREAGYGLVLQGGGIGVLYLSIFAAAKIYALIPLGLAFGILFIIVILGTALALLQNAQVLAILSTAGGFLAPILTSTGEGSHVALFSFYLILNLGILSIALYKAWRLLNWVGFMFTFVITAAWGVLKYEPALFVSTQPFLIAFFVLYLTVAILFSFKQPTNLKGFVDGSLVFGLPLVAFGLQTCLLKHTEHGLTISALVLSFIYLGLSAWLVRRYLDTHRVLIESFLALGVGFATLAIPLALDAQWTSATWALEAVGLVWIGLRQQRLRPRVVGYLLHTGAVISLLINNGLNAGDIAIISGDFIALALVALTALTISYLLDRFAGQAYNAEAVISLLARGFGLWWWFIAGVLEIDHHVQQAYQFASIILFISVTAIAIMAAGAALKWASIVKNIFVLLPTAIFCAAAFYSSSGAHPVQGFGLVALAIFFIVQYRFLFLQDSIATKGLLSAWHILTAWLLFALIIWEAAWQQSHLALQGSMRLILWLAAIIIPGVVLLWRNKTLHWPFDRFENDYKNWVPMPLFVLSGCWFLFVCHRAQVMDEPYLPLLNLLDLGQFAVLVLFGYLFHNDYFNETFLAEKIARVGLLGAMLFIWVNVLALRAVHQYQAIPYYAESLWNAPQVQMTLSILWTLCALCIMHLSRRLQHRKLWMLGAVLLGVVVLKLATKDLSNSGTLAIIISFMVVGALMLLIGFMSPIPPKANDVVEEKHE